MSTVVHIASFIVQCRPDVLDAVRAAVEQDICADIHGSDPSGKLIVLMETDTASDVTAAASRIWAMNGVLSCNLIYHAMDEEDAPLQESRA